MSIPRRIIQTGKTRELSPLAKASATNLKLLHPGWEYVFFDDQDVALFVADQFPEYEAVFKAFRHPIQRIDFFRYLAIFRLGGFYFDQDVLLSESIEPLTHNDCVFPFEELTLSSYLRREYQMDWEIGNYAFGGRAGHPFLRAVIENCVRTQRDAAWVRPMMAGIPRMFRAEFEVLNTTGPGLLSRTLAESPGAIADLTVLFPEDVCDLEKWHQFGHYGLHLMDGSWRMRGRYLRRRLGNLWEAWTLRKRMEDSRCRGKGRGETLYRRSVGGVSQSIV